RAMRRYAGWDRECGASVCSLQTAGGADWLDPRADPSQTANTTQHPHWSYLHYPQCLGLHVPEARPAATARPAQAAKYAASLESRNSAFPSCRVVYARRSYGCPLTQLLRPHSET